MYFPCIEKFYFSYVFCSKLYFIFLTQTIMHALRTTRSFDISDFAGTRR